MCCRHRSVPYEVTLKAVDDLYKEGCFKRFGISGPSWEVAEIVGICKRFGCIQPTVYQGFYNAIHRGVEPELFPCLRKFRISFYEFNSCTSHLLLPSKSICNTLMGASGLNHIEQNLIDLEKGPLPDEVVEALDEASANVKPYAS
ncbi:NADP-dependent oxidoreductase domain-containing protein [Mycena latifolia]|nr:NADP-dependent oxidoreductase domain-containing protein [Mycena latifolia]